MPAQSVQPMIEPSGNICGGTSSFVPAGDGCGCGSTGPSGNICGGTSSYVPGGGCGCGGTCGNCGGGTVPSGNICGGTSSFVPGGGGCGSCSACRAEQAAQAATVPSGNICGGTSIFTPAGDSCRCGSCVTKRFHRGTKNQFPGVRRVGTNPDDLRGRNFIPSPPATDKRREMLPNGGGVVQIIPTRTAEPVKAQGNATPAMIPAATTKPTDLGGGPAPTPTAVMAEGKKEDLGGGVAVPAITAAAADATMSLGQSMDKLSIAQSKGGLTSAGLWPVYGASGAPMSNPRGVLSIDELPFGASVFVDGMRVNLEYTHRDQTYGIAWAQEGVHTIMVVDQKGNIRSVKALITREERPIRYSSMPLGQRFGSSGAPMSSGATGWLIFDALPAGASVFVDGMRVGMTFDGVGWWAFVPEGKRSITVVDQKGNARSTTALIDYRKRIIPFSSLSLNSGFRASGAPMAVIQPMRFANPSKPSFVPGMGMARASGGMYRPSGDQYDDAEASMTSDLDWNQQLLRDTADPAADGGKGDSGGKDFGTPARREPSTTDYIRSIGGVATAALEGISRTIGQQADIRLRELMASNANAANVRSEANRQLQIELDAGIRSAQVAAQRAGSSERLAQLQAEITAMREASTRSATLAQTNAPPSTPLVSPTTNTDEGLSTGAKVGIGVGAVAVLGLGAYLVMRKR